MSLVENVGVIVRQFFSNFHIPDRFDPDPAVLDYGITVRIARVVDKPRIVPVDRRVDHDVIVNREEIRVMSLAFVVGVPLVRLTRRTCTADSAQLQRRVGAVATRVGSQRAS